MRRFEYDIEVHPAGAFQELVSLCTSDGTCWDEAFQGDVAITLVKIFNDRGERGWELVQLSLSTRGVVSFWKRVVQ